MTSQSPSLLPLNLFFRFNVMRSNIFISTRWAADNVLITGGKVTAVCTFQPFNHIKNIMYVGFTKKKTFIRSTLFLNISNHSIYLLYIFCMWHQRLDFFLIVCTDILVPCEVQKSKNDHTSLTVSDRLMSLLVLIQMRMFLLRTFRYVSSWHS